MSCYSHRDLDKFKSLEFLIGQECQIISENNLITAGIICAVFKDHDNDYEFHILGTDGEKHQTWLFPTARELLTL